MTLQEALAAGDKVRRSKWKAGRYAMRAPAACVGKSGGSLLVDFNSGRASPLELKPSACSSDDWEVLNA